MNFSRGKTDKTIDVNLTPLIDVVFLLLIFFMVSTSFVFTNSLKVNLPKAKGDTVDIKKNVNIVITKEDKISIDGKVISKTRLLEKLKILNKKHPNATIVLQADADSKHGDVVYVMDKSKKAGFKKFAIAAEDE
jgi:biopolymer transport protein ExbD